MSLVRIKHTHIVRGIRQLKAPMSIICLFKYINYMLVQIYIEIGVFCFQTSSLKASVKVNEIIGTDYCPLDKPEAVSNLR